MGDKKEVVLFGVDSSTGRGPVLPLLLNNEQELLVAASQYINGERVLPNASLILLTSGSRTSPPLTFDNNNYFYKGAHFIINVTSITGSPSIVPIIQTKAFASDHYEILRGNPITTTGINILKIYPGITPIPNLSANDILPSIYKIIFEHGNGDAITYEAHVSLVI